MNTGKLKKSLRAMKILLIALALVAAMLAVYSCSLGLRLEKLETVLAAKSADEPDLHNIADLIGKLQQENMLLQESVKALSGNDSAVTKHLADIRTSIDNIVEWQDKYTSLLNGFEENSPAEIYNVIDSLAMRDDERYNILCEELNSYAYSVSRSLGSLETDMDTIFAFSGDTANALNSISENIDGMGKDISRLFNRVNTLRNDRQIIFVERPSPPRIPHRPSHAPRPQPPKPSIVPQPR